MRQRTLEPREAADPLLGLLAAQLQDATRDWRVELGEPTRKALVWQPHELGHSIGAILLHLADSEAFWMMQATGVRRPRGEAKALLASEIRQYGGKWPVPPDEPLAWYYGVMDGIRARTLESLRTLDDPDRLIQKPAWGVELSVKWIVSHIILHEAYHGGQAVLLHEQFRRCHRKRPAG